MFKFSLGQVVWYLDENKVHSAPVLSRMCIDNHHDDWACTNEQKEVFQRFGASTVKYATIHGEYHEGSLFGSKEELLKSFADG